MPGFLFDMNRFFQALVSRFLHEYLDHYLVQDEYRLKNTFTYDPDHNPQRRRPPTPRPDFVVMQGRRVAGVLDAKYRDLWERGLPEDMLYQLAIYALLRDSPNHQSTILYPTTDAAASDQVINLQDPVRGTIRARVILRPVKLLELERLLRDNYQVRRRRVEFAHYLVFGAHSYFG